jgi:glycosyltransferase involved in cell wall biosynthesis
MRQQISSALIVKNEEKHIRQCLDSVKWTDEIVVIDGYSTDNTVQVCKEYTDKIYQRKFEGFNIERQELLSKCSNKWVLMVDADMIIPEETKNEILTKLNDNNLDRFAAYNFRTLNIYLGKKIHHCGWFDPTFTRFFNKEKGGYDTRLRYIDHFIPIGNIGIMGNYIIHYGSETITEHFKHINRYSTLNAYDLKIKNIKIKWYNIVYYFLIKPIIVFIYKYFYKLGFLDNFQGFAISTLSAVTYFVSYLKLYEMQKE